MGTKLKLGKTEENEDLRKEVSYPPEWESNLYESYFSVEAPYEIITREDGEEVIVSCNRSKKKDKYDRSTITKMYNPFDEPYLFEKAARVDTEDRDSILAFCNQYGLFNEDDRVSQYTSRPPVVFSKPVTTFVRNEFLTLKTFIKHIDSIKKNLDLVKIIQERDEYSLNKFKDKIIDVLNYAHEVHSLKNGKEPSEEENHLLREVKSTPALMVAKTQLLQWLNWRLEYIYPTMKLGVNGEFVPGYKSNSLLAVIYFQIHEMVTKSQPLETCLRCGSVFTPRKGGSKFCPSDEPGKRSSCENSYNQMKHKARKAVSTGQKTIEEICKQSGRSFAEVSSWVEGTTKH